VDAIPRPVVASLQLRKNNILDHGGQILKERNLLEIKRYKIFLIGSSFWLLAYFRDGHELPFIVRVHEIDEAVFLGKPFGEGCVLSLVECNCLRVRMARIAL
jgi:hypothetical protein